MHTIRNKMAAPGYVYTLEDKLCVPSEAVRIGLPPALVSLRFRYVRVPSYMIGVHRCLVSSARSAQKVGGKKKKKEYEKIWRKTVYDAFLLRALRVAFGYPAVFTTLK